MPPLVRRQITVGCIWWIQYARGVTTLVGKHVSYFPILVQIYHYCYQPSADATAHLLLLTGVASYAPAADQLLRRLFFHQPTVAVPCQLLGVAEIVVGC